MIIWESISDYSKRTGTSKDTVRKMIKSGLLESESTDGGGKIMIKVDLESTEVEKMLLLIDQKLDALCKHLGVKI